MNETKNLPTTVQALTNTQLKKGYKHNHQGKRQCKQEHVYNRQDPCTD